MSEGWAIKSLGEVAEIRGGKRVPKGYKLETGPTGYPYITVSDFTDDGTVSTAAIRYVSREVFEQIKRYTISKNDLYVSIAGTIGKTGSVPVQLDGASLTENACKLVLGREIDRDFLYYFTKTNDFLAQATAHTRTAAQPKLALERLKTIKLCVPSSVVEQRRIVAILDEAFASIAIARANAEGNLQNARELFEAYLEAEIGKNWKDGKSARLVDLASDITDGDHMPPPKSAQGVPFITIGNIDKRTKTIDFTDAFRVPQDYFQNLKSNRRPKGGDILYTVTGSYGVPVLVSDDAPFCFQRHIALVRPRAEVDSRWVYWLLASPQVRRQADAGARGAAQKTVSLTLLRGFDVPRVNRTRQVETVTNLDRMHKEAQQLESVYQHKLAALDELKQSLLHEAFSGKL